LISSLSAVIATVVVSQFWAAGTLFFTALVPVAVAVVSEILRRPAEKITEVARSWRRASCRGCDRTARRSASPPTTGPCRRVTTTHSGCTPPTGRPCSADARCGSA
jgi:hypothetical protein